MATQSISQSLLNSPKIWTVIKELSPPGSAMHEIFSALAQSGMSPANMFDGLKNTQTFTRDAADKARKTAGNLGSFMSNMKQRTNPQDTSSMVDRGISPDDDFSAFPEEDSNTDEPNATPQDKSLSPQTQRTSQPSMRNKNKSAAPVQSAENAYKPFANPGESVFPEGTSPQDAPHADTSGVSPNADNQTQPVDEGKPTNLSDENTNQTNRQSFFDRPQYSASRNSPLQKAQKQTRDKSRRLAKPLENDLKTTNKKLKPIERKIRELKTKKAAVQASMLLILIGVGILFLLSGLFFILIITFKLGMLFGGWAIALITNTYPKLTHELTKIEIELKKMKLSYNQLKKHQKDVENNISQIYQSAQTRVQQLQKNPQ